jgi:DMSO/TMAO reductase YedYZ molybdopterin-dependent catalytic subunit
MKACPDPFDGSSRLRDRRGFLQRVAAAGGVVPLVGPGFARRGLAGQEGADGVPSGTSGVLIPRQRNPENLEYPFASLDSFLTPNEQFFVRTHFEVPEIARGDWRLAVTGEVERPLELREEELRAMPSRTVTAVIECNGNGRDFLDPPQVGIRWELGGVSNAEWTGVPLAAVLERAGVKRGAVEVVLEGADQGQYREPVARTPGVIRYSRSLSLQKAMSPEVLLAYAMNGRELTSRHGFPLRAVVPGWYGMASVKWLRRIEVTSRPFLGYFQTFAYSIWEDRGGLLSLAPVTELRVKAQIARPASFEVVPRGSTYLVRGAAWTGAEAVAKVEFSDDGGESWSLATLEGPTVPFAWRLWRFVWRTPDRPGRKVVMARATDSAGQVQPMTRDPLLRDTSISHVLPIEVEVA